ncbi:MAG: hypothetical protein AAGA53_01325 [Pseudomonadota bacterium]
MTGHFTENISAESKERIERSNYRRELDFQWCDDGQNLKIRTDPNKAWHETQFSKATSINFEESARTVEEIISLFRESGAAQIRQEIDLINQKKIGRALFQKFVAETDEFIVDQSWIHINPHLADEDARDRLRNFLLQIPWSMMTEADSADANMLGRNGTVFTVNAAPRSDGEHKWPNVYWPFNRKVLLVCTTSDPKIDGIKHKDEILKKLAVIPHSGPFSLETRCVSSFLEFSKEVSDWGPHIIYFYGHGSLIGDTTALEFDEMVDGKLVPKSYRIEELRGVLDKHPDGFAPVVWINACNSGAAERASALTLLAERAPVVMATRSEVFAKSAGSLAELVLPKIVEGTPPPTALREVSLGLPDPVIGAAQWCSTIIAVQYELWYALGKSDLSIEESGDFTNRINRTDQIGNVKENIDQIITAQKNSVSRITWYGPGNQAPDLFEKRLWEWILENYPDRQPQIKKVELQLDSSAIQERQNMETVFLRLVCSSLNKSIRRGRWDDLKNQLGSLKENGCELLVLFHGVFEPMNEEVIQQYENFWRILQESDELSVPCLLAFWQTADQQNEHSENLIMLESLKPGEISAHLDFYCENYNMRTKDRQEVARDLCQKHKGSYRKIYNELTKLVSITYYE